MTTTRGQAQWQAALATYLASQPRDTSRNRAVTVTMPARPSASTHVVVPLPQFVAALLP